MESRLAPAVDLVLTTVSSSPICMDLPFSLVRDISPPRVLKRRGTSEARLPVPHTEALYDVKNDPTLAAVEAGKAKIEDHLTYFEKHLAKVTRRTAPEVSRLSIDDYASLYKNNNHQHGHHFVIHQHNHPRAGVHYDLRLQFSATSSISWALPKGLPGDPNSKQLGRMAIETRVHNLWNNLIESASLKTGSLLIWDTGTYSILPRHQNEQDISSLQTTDDESDVDVRERGQLRNGEHENEKLIRAFESHHIRLRLHGTRLPKNYTITLRLPSNNDVSKAPASRRRKRGPIVHTSRRPSNTLESNSDSNSDPNPQPTPLDTDSEDDVLTRRHNAYPGSHNTVGSIHQRRWFVLLDRRSSGFVINEIGTWVQRRLQDGEVAEGFERFVVRGRDWERSVVTGRLAAEVQSDEGCGEFVGRGGWVGIG
ncbi:hypothetical protein N0V94_006886 [Neodidymelliopsis sp. IMI 364377]|nr:hypothetical protein N0V94_006886 [Neodidymelliopsis sp. IMI 364377]